MHNSSASRDPPRAPLYLCSHPGPLPGWGPFVWRFHSTERWCLIPPSGTPVTYRLSVGFAPVAGDLHQSIAAPFLPPPTSGTAAVHFVEIVEERIWVPIFGVPFFLFGGLSPHWETGPWPRPCHDPGQPLHMDRRVEPRGGGGGPVGGRGRSL